MSKVHNGATKYQLVLVCLLEGILIVHTSTLLYASVGDDIAITCPSNKILVWTFLKTDAILAFCDGKKEIDMTLHISNRLHLSSNCTLRIIKFKKEDVGRYKCSHPSDRINGMISHITNIQLRKIRIAGTNNYNSLQTAEGENITLTCIIDGEKPGETLHWKSSEKLLKSGMPPILNYTFISKANDNKKYYTCGANRSDYTHPLTSRVQLFVLHKPSVLIRVCINSVQVTYKNSVTVKERDKLEMLCQLLNESAGSIRWSHNKLTLSNRMSNNLVFEKVDRKIKGKFVCTGLNVAGQDSDSINVSVEYTPLITNTNRVFSTADKPRNLKCEVSGVPNIFKFNKWRHLVNGQHVRFLNGNADGTLTLPCINTSDIQYDDSGLYICNVSNNIRNWNGQLWQTGTVNVTIKDKPVLAKQHEQIYIGQNVSTTSVAFYLLSSSELSTATWVNEGNSAVQTTQCAATTMKTNFHGTLVNVSGYICNCSITETQGMIFQNYSVSVSNDCCCNTFNFSIRSARKPGKPNILDYTSSSTWIYVLMEPGSDSGINQEFIIEYRKQQNKKWKWLSVENVGTSSVSDYISSLDPSTAYEFRVIARNSIGNSSSTETYRVLTKDEKKNFKIGNTIIITVTTVLTACLIIVCWRRRKAEKNLSLRSQIVEHSNQGGAIENSIYQSTSDLSEPPSASGIVRVSNRSIGRRKTNVDRQIVGYNIVRNEDSTRLFDCREFNKREEKNISYDTSTLNYVEVAFDPAEARSKFYIHGADNRTPYADIDFSLTADPLTSSDGESVNSHEDNNDFVSLEDVQQWNIHES